MARELRWWLAAVLLACGAVAVAYLPPRGAARGVGLRDEPFRQTTARLRAQALAAQWRTASLALRLPEYRKRLQPELLRRRERDEPGPALLVEAPDSVAAFARQRLRATLDTVSGQLGLGVTKVSVGLVVDLWRYVSANAGETPSQDFESPGYLFPDSSDRTTCVALIPAWRWTGTLAVQPQVRHQRVEDMLRTALGPCAFYAAYGTPGRGVRHWLAKRGYDLARVPLWDRERPERPQDSFVMYQDGTRWWWGSVYRFPVTAIGCLAGRALSCRAAVLSGAEEASDDSLPRFLESDPRGWWRRQRLLYSDRYLADVVREVGHDRFLRFWNSTDPVDTALATALKMPVGEWTERWQRRFVPRLPLGPAAPFSATVIGLLLGGAAVAVVAVGARRRQVS
ncbi:MAG: hypothetical protein DMD69_12930 [Gemmatimonadetes bacterium]|nr:MAG: hypothetical protein DMD69_12930 [Gemmatimonadota bacterium]